MTEKPKRKRGRPRKERPVEPEVQGQEEAQVPQVIEPDEVLEPSVIAAPPAHLPWAPYQTGNPIADALTGQGATDDWIARELLKIYQIATRERDGKPDYRLKKQILEYVIQLKGYEPAKRTVQEVHRSSFEMALEINKEDYLPKN